MEYQQNRPENVFHKWCKNATYKKIKIKIQLHIKKKYDII